MLLDCTLPKPQPHPWAFRDQLIAMHIPSQMQGGVVEEDAQVHIGLRHFGEGPPLFGYLRQKQCCAAATSYYRCNGFLNSHP